MQTIYTRTRSLLAKRAGDLMRLAATLALILGITPALAQQAYYIHPDHLNTPRLIENQSQQVVWRWDNEDPFGANMANANPSGLGAFTFNPRLPGQYFDAETNYHYNYFRDYSPETGRYVQSDPIGLRGGMNTYSYVISNPLRWVDPLGLNPGMGGYSEDCSWYVSRCIQSGGTSYYYCNAAPLVCKYTPSSPWTGCVRKCLQDFDKACSRNVDGSPSTNCVITAHVHCWLECPASQCSQ